MSDIIGIPLAEAIQVIRKELQKAKKEGTGEKMQFKLGLVQLELNVQVSQESSGEAGIKFWLISVGGKGKQSSAETHKVTLTLEPVDEKGKPQQIADTLEEGEEII